MTEQQACTLCGAGGHTAAQCNWNKADGAHVPDAVFEAEFMTWWEEHGQYCRSGGGDYERTFAFQAWRHLYPQLMAALAQPSPAFAKPSLLKDCDVRYAANAQPSPELEQYKAILRTLVEEATCADWSGENDESVFHAAQQWCGKYHEAKRQLEAAQARGAELEQALAEKDPFGAKLNRISEKLERCDALLVAQAAEAGQVPGGWKVGHPTQPGAYYVRGFRLFEGDSPAALVEVALDGDDLVCNLHESNSEEDLGRWSLLSDFNEGFEWFGPLAAPPAQGD